jgi:hypothetical protein
MRPLACVCFSREKNVSRRHLSVPGRGLLPSGGMRPLASVCFSREKNVSRRHLSVPAPLQSMLLPARTCVSTEREVLACQSLLRSRAARFPPGSACFAAGRKNLAACRQRRATSSGKPWFAPHAQARSITLCVESPSSRPTGSGSPGR